MCFVTQLPCLGTEETLFLAEYCEFSLDYERNKLVCLVINITQFVTYYRINDLFPHPIYPNGRLFEASILPKIAKKNHNF